MKESRKVFDFSREMPTKEYPSFYRIDPQKSGRINVVRSSVDLKTTAEFERQH
jgi:hypothetical protein